MAAKIRIGNILIERKTLWPGFLWFKSERVSDGWILVRNLDRYKLDRKVREAGWKLSSLGSEVKASGFGPLNVEKTIHRALRRVLTGLKSEHFNCLEITDVQFSRFLGFPHAIVSGRPRMIQEGPPTAPHFG